MSTHTDAMTDPDKTDPGFEKLPDGTIIIGPDAVRAQLKRQEEEAIANAQKVVDEINDAAANGQAPGSEAGSDQPDSKKNSGA